MVNKESQKQLLKLINQIELNILNKVLKILQKPGLTSEDRFKEILKITAEKENELYD